MAQKKVYGKEFKFQAVKPGREIRFSKAAKELGINTDTLCGWNKCAKEARLDLEPETQTPNAAMSLTKEVQKPRQQICACNFKLMKRKPSGFLHSKTFTCLPIFAWLPYIAAINRNVPLAATVPQE